MPLQIQAKVAQVRNDLPQAEAPTIGSRLRITNSRRYLGFSSGSTRTDYGLSDACRAAQTQLGVQRADILGDRTFAMRIWLKPDEMAAHGISPSAVRDALARNNYLSALGRTKGSMVSVNLIANTDLRTPEEFRQLVVKEEKGVVVRLGALRTSCWARRTTSRTFIHARRHLYGRLGSADVIHRRDLPGSRRHSPNQSQLPRNEDRHSYDSTEYIKDASAGFER
jgi:multidrug efflux pump